MERGNIVIDKSVQFKLLFIFGIWFEIDWNLFNTNFVLNRPNRIEGVLLMLAATSELEISIKLKYLWKYSEEFIYRKMDHTHSLFDVYDDKERITITKTIMFSFSIPLICYYKYSTFRYNGLWMDIQQEKKTNIQSIFVYRNIHCIEHNNNQLNVP